MRGDQQVDASYFRTRLPVDECRRRMEERVGRARWRLVVGDPFLTLGKYCDKPLQGTVDLDGFEVAETDDRGWATKELLVRGRWAARGEWTILRLRPHVSWGFWIGQVIGGGILAAALTMVAIAIAGRMSGPEVGACLLGFWIMCSAVLLWLHSRRLSSLGRELSRRFGVLFGAEPVDQSDGQQLDTYFRD